MTEFPYVTVRDSRGQVGLRPLLPITLGNREIPGLLDSGADVNVLPYHLGLALGAVWENQQTAVQLSGNLANYEARGLLLTATVANFPPVTLAFAWTRAEDVPLILGQVNFFAEFEVCFFRSRKLFSVAPKN